MPIAVAYSFACAISPRSGNALRNTIGTGETFFSLNTYAPSVIHLPCHGVSMRPVSKVRRAASVSPLSDVTVSVAVYVVKGLSGCPA